MEKGTPKLMKKKSKKQKLKRKSEFRFHVVKTKEKKNKGGHPAYIFLQKGNLFIYVSITHSSEIDNELVIKLKQNPNPGDPRNAYYVLEIREDTKDTFGSRHKNWKIDESDDEDIRELYNQKIKNR